MKPNFLIIGAARSGTTSLFKYLENHPDIFMSEIKEINFFSNEKYWRKGFDWYEKHFDAATEKSIGEASTSYTCFPEMTETPQRIFSYTPDVRLIYLIRDPIDRFISHYLHRVSRGVESRNITDIIDNDKDDFMLNQGRYYMQLEQYLEYFDLDKILLLSIEHLKNEPAEAVRRIYDFLGVDPAIADTQTHSRHNVNTRITRKSSLGRAILKFYHNHIEQVAFPYSFKKLFLKAAEIGAVEIDSPELDETSLAALKEYYRPDIKKLVDMTSMDVSEWRDYNI